MSVETVPPVEEDTKPEEDDPVFCPPGYVPRSLPTEMVGRDRWILWEYQERQGRKPGKVPVDGWGNSLSWKDPDAQGSFRETYETFRIARSSDPDGFGFVFREDGPLCGVDLDNCRDPETDAIALWAWRIIHELDSYTEVSPSGTGIHIIVKGSLPDEFKSRAEGIEVYDKERYFTVSRQRVEGTRGTIENRQEALEDVCGAYLPKDESSPEEPDAINFDLSAVKGPVGEYTNQYGRTLNEVMADSDRLRTYLNDPEPFDSPSPSEGDHRAAGSLASHGFTVSDSVDIITEYRTREKVRNRPDYVVDTVKDAHSESTVESGVARSGLGTGEYICLLPDVEPVSDEWGGLEADTDPARTERNGFYYSQVGSTLSGYAHKKPTVVEAVPGTGKSTGMIKAVSEEEPVTVLTSRVDLYEDYEERCEQEGLSYETIPSFTRHCPTATGAHGEDAQERVMDLYSRDVTPAEIHALLPDLPCQENGTCPYQQGNDFDPETVDVVIGHYRHAHRDGLTRRRTVAFDEFPSTAFIDEYSASTVQPAVSWWLGRTEEVPFDDYEELLTDRDSDRAENAREYFRENPPQRDGETVAKVSDPDAHGLAPLFTYSVLTADGQSNGWESVNFDHDGGSGRQRRGARRKHDGTLFVLNPPLLHGDGSDARNVIGLDGTPCERMWELAVDTRLNTERVPSKDEHRREYITECRGMDIIPIGTDTYPVSSGNYVNVEKDRAIIEAVREREGTDPYIITSRKAINQYEEAGVLDMVEGWDYYGNVNGSNQFEDVEVGIVLGSPHYGDGFVKKWGAFAGDGPERIERNERTDREQYSTEFGNDVLHYMREDQVLQSVLRFGRVLNESNVYVRTTALPEWVPTTDGRGTVVPNSGTRREILDALSDGEEHGASDLAHGLDVSPRRVRQVLSELHEHGVVEREDPSDPTKPTVWSWPEPRV